MRHLDLSNAEKTLLGGQPAQVSQNVKNDDEFLANLNHTASMDSDSTIEARIQLNSSVDHSIFGSELQESKENITYFDPHKMINMSQSKELVKLAKQVPLYNEQTQSNDKSSRGGKHIG